jgi:hypothetical protein
MERPVSPSGILEDKTRSDRCGVIVPASESVTDQRLSKYTGNYIRGRLK